MGGTFWVANEGDGNVSIINIDDGSLIGSFDVPGASGIWVAEGLLGDGWIESFAGTIVSRFAPDAGR